MSRELGITPTKDQTGIHPAEAEGIGEHDLEAWPDARDSARNQDHTQGQDDQG